MLSMKIDKHKTSLEITNFDDNGQFTNKTETFVIWC